MNCSTEIKRKNCKSIIVSCIYRHFFCKINWFNHLEECVKLLDYNKTQNIITGDFNIDVPMPNESKTPLELMQDYGLNQIIKTPTRITQRNSTCIDLTFTNIDKYTSGVACVSVADHLMNFVILGQKNDVGGAHCYRLLKFKVKLYRLWMCRDLTGNN